MKRIFRAGFAALMGAVGTPAQAAGPQPAEPPPVIEPFHPFQIRLKLGGVIPSDGQASIFDRGLINASTSAVAGYPATVLQATGLSYGANTPFIGASTNISSAIVPLLDVSYYLSKNWAIEAICCLTPHNVSGTGPLQGASVIKTWVFPPSLTLQYHVTDFGAFQPYFGVGVNFTAYLHTRAGNQPFPIALPQVGALGVPPFSFTALTTAYSATITPSWGVVGQGGVDYMFNDRWGVNFDVKYIVMQPKAHVWAAALTAPTNIGPVYAPLNLNVPINPVVISAGLTYRFGADWGVPKLLPF
jgi:outer membrane protein